MVTALQVAPPMLAPAATLGERRRLTDLSIVSQVQLALLKGWVELAFQGIYGAQGTRSLLYRACLPRVYDARGARIAPHQFMPSLRRHGMTGWFDYHVFEQVTDLLGMRADLTLGMRVAGRSVQERALWEPVLRRLGRLPDGGERLVIELAELGGLSADWHQGWFVKQVKDMGCRLAIRDFGADDAVVRAVPAGLAEVIKLDRGVMSAVARGACSVERLARWMGEALDRSACVVVEGIETEQEFLLARQVGAEWLQGRYVGRVTRRALPGEATRDARYAGQGCREQDEGLSRRR
ncbi:EAL domain-containing protein [Burkholderia pyrrocinia]